MEADEATGQTCWSRPFAGASLWFIGETRKAQIGSMDALPRHLIRPGRAHAVSCLLCYRSEWAHWPACVWTQLAGDCASGSAQIANGAHPQNYGNASGAQAAACCRCGHFLLACKSQRSSLILGRPAAGICLHEYPHAGLHRKPAAKRIEVCI